MYGAFLARNDGATTSTSRDIFTALSPLLRDEIWQNQRLASTYLRLTNYDDVTTSRLLDKHLWIYLHFYKTSNNQIWQDGKPVCTDSTLQVIMESLIVLSLITSKLTKNLLLKTVLFFRGNCKIKIKSLILFFRFLDVNAF